MKRCAPSTASAMTPTTRATIFWLGPPISGPCTSGSGSPVSSRLTMPDRAVTQSISARDGRSRRRLVPISRRLAHAAPPRRQHAPSRQEGPCSSRCGPRRLLLRESRMRLHRAACLCRCAPCRAAVDETQRRHRSSTGDRGLVSVFPSYQPGRSAHQGCAAPPKCCAFWLPHAPLRGAFGVLDRRFAGRCQGLSSMRRASPLAVQMTTLNNHPHAEFDRLDRKSVVTGKRVSVLLALGCALIIKKNKKNTN